MMCGFSSIPQITTIPAASTTADRTSNGQRTRGQRGGAYERTAPIMNRNCHANGLKNQTSPAIQLWKFRPVARVVAYSTKDAPSSSTGRRNSGNATAKISSSMT